DFSKPAGNALAPRQETPACVLHDHGRCVFSFESDSAASRNVAADGTICGWQARQSRRLRVHESALPPAVDRLVERHSCLLLFGLHGCEVAIVDGAWISCWSTAAVSTQAGGWTLFYSLLVSFVGGGVLFSRWKVYALLHDGAAGCVDNERARDSIRRPVARKLGF